MRRAIGEANTRPPCPLPAVLAALFAAVFAVAWALIVCVVDDDTECEPRPPAGSSSMTVAVSRLAGAGWALAGAALPAAELAAAACAGFDAPAALVPPVGA